MPSVILIYSANANLSPNSMFQKRIFSSPKAPGIELHSQMVGEKNDSRTFSIYEKGVLVSDDFEIPEGMSVEHFIEGFFAGAAYAAGEMRRIKLKI